MRRTLIVTLAATVMASGCLFPEIGESTVRRHAASVMSCPADEITMSVQTGKGDYIATGCSRRVHAWCGWSKTLPRHVVCESDGLVDVSDDDRPIDWQFVDDLRGILASLPYQQCFLQETPQVDVVLTLEPDGFTSAVELIDADGDADESRCVKSLLRAVKFRHFRAQGAVKFHLAHARSDRPRGIGAPDTRAAHPQTTILRRAPPRPPPSCCV